MQTHRADLAFSATNVREFDAQDSPKTLSDGMSHGGVAGNVIMLLRMVQSDLHMELKQDKAAQAEAVSQDAEQVALCEQQKDAQETEGRCGNGHSRIG